MGYRYVGAGSFYHGIPARDLSQAEYEALTEDQRKLVREGSLYRHEKDDAVAGAAADEAAPAQDAREPKKEGE